MRNTVSCIAVDLASFDRVKELFPNDYAERYHQLENREIDIYVVEYDSAYVGRIIANFRNQHLEEETIHGKRVCLSHFILKSKYRNKGLGSKLLDYAINDLSAQGYIEFTVGVEDKNDIAKHLYFGRGFTEKIGHGSIPCEYDLYIRRK